eukprot:NODE_4126_length_839_cov_7.137975_g3414_i0.p1 GENE.NODE_4126_length_839_cov_7.137975_g3414_i0~~NODE_4126_length_839_cov_7.137975_g3414_i0.p1  ORF type:complete len:211 (-),score=49.79 NODE_4126_length_839_cov_7.137975_g3414_i0:78-710(-)
MGNQQSTPAGGAGGPPSSDLSANEKREALVELQSSSGFSQDQIETLYNHFQRISSLREADGLVSKDEFLDVLQAKSSVLLDRMFALFDKDSSGHIDFREFLVGLSILCDKGSKEAKLKFAFKMYDLDGDGFISKDELLKIVESCLFQNSLSLPTEALQKLVDATFRQADIDGDGRITVEEFDKYVINHPQVIEQLTINSDTLRQVQAQNK